MANDERSSARIHWLVAGRFSAQPRGDFLSVSLGNFDQVLADRLGTLRLEVADRLGSGETRELGLEVRNLRSLTLAGVVEAVPELKALRALAERPPPPDELVPAVEKIVGPGKLSAVCAGLLQSEAGAGAARRSEAAAAVDAFVKSVTSTPAGLGSGAARKLRQEIEGAVYGTALELLQAEPVRSLEPDWRALRMLLGECPAGSDMQVELLDAALEDVARTVRARPIGDAFDEPDVLFMVEPAQTTDALSGLAELGEELLAPCVVAVAPELLEATTTAELAARVTRGDPLPTAWEGLRSSEATRWLCAAVNPVAVFSEGSGAYKRTVFGSPAWAIAAMLAAGFRNRASFASAVGRSGAFTAPAGWTIPSGVGAGSRAPTEAFLGLQPQKELAVRGMVALGSVKDADRLVIAAAPMVAVAADAMPLPAQLLAGRIVRFARWTQRQLAPELPPEQVGTVFEQAAKIFLFPGMEGAAALGAQVQGEGEKRVLKVAARVKSSHALVPLSIEFELPM